MFHRIIIIIMIIIQKIYTVHNPLLKARAQCAHRKCKRHTCVKTITEKKNKWSTPWTTIQSTRRKKVQNNSQKGAMP